MQLCNAHLIVLILLLVAVLETVHSLLPLSTRSGVPVKSRQSVNRLLPSTDSRAVGISKMTGSRPSLLTRNVATGSSDDNDFKNEENLLNDVNSFIVRTFKDLLSTQFNNRPYARFYALETIARVPYFSYTSVLHLYETIGQFRRKEYIQLHFSESWNEMHHLLIMEELGGDDEFKDRFVATHLAFFYYWVVVLLYMFSPSVAYNLNMHIEQHAYETYNDFLAKNSVELKSLPVPKAAQQYYIDDFEQRLSVNQHLLTIEDSIPIDKPKLDNLYDVFTCIRDDEALHADTMKKLQTLDIFDNDKME